MTDKYFSLSCSVLPKFVLVYFCFGHYIVVCP